MSKTNNSTFHIKVVIAVIAIIFFVFIFAHYYDGTEAQAKVLAWFERPLSKADMGDLFILFYLHGMWMWSMRK